MGEIPKTTIAYLAGFFDGEGHIIIVKDKSRSGNVNYKLRIGARQVCNVPLVMLQKHFGGLLQYQEKKNPNHRDIYSWEVTSVKALVMLKALLPFLTVKKEQAVFAIAWANKNYLLKGKKKTIEDYAALEADKLTLSKMKRVTYGRNS